VRTHLPGQGLLDAFRNFPYLSYDVNLIGSRRSLQDSLFSVPESPYPFLRLSDFQILRASSEAMQI
jgi:hypothetical protein